MKITEFYWAPYGDGTFFVAIREEGKPEEYAYIVARGLSGQTAKKCVEIGNVDYLQKRLYQPGSYPAFDEILHEISEVVVDRMGNWVKQPDTEEAEHLLNDCQPKTVYLVVHNVHHTFSSPDPSEWETREEILLATLDEDYANEYADEHNQANNLESWQNNVAWVKHRELSSRPG